MADELPDNYDAIVLGTGMTECILAAAIARAGYSVLHLDRNDFYSGDWGTFHFLALQKWIQKHQGQDLNPLNQPNDDEVPKLLKEGERVLKLKIESTSIQNIEENAYISDTAPEEEAEIPKNTVKEKPVNISQEITESKNIQSQLDTKETGQTVPLEQKKEETNEIIPQELGDVATGVELSTEEKQDKDKAVLEQYKNGAQEETKDCETRASNLCNPSEITKEHCEGTVQEEQVAKVDTRDSESPINAAEPAEGQTEGSELNTTASKSSEEENRQKNCVKPKRKVWSMSGLKKEWRKFNLDLAPKLLYSRGDMVELLISSDIAKYCEFKTITRILTHLNGKLEQVPCSRSDVFASKQVSMIEKRMMMKLLTNCAEYEKHPEEYEGFTDKPFIEFLKSKKLSANVLHYVLNAIAMVTEKTTTIDGLQSTQKFLQSLGRFGNTAFLWPMYGTGELPQGFCRMCAVFGGIYCLRRTAASLIIDSNNKATGIVDTEGKRLNCSWLVMESDYANSEILAADTSSRSVSRAILLTNRSILPTKEEQLTLLSLPAAQGADGRVSVLELGPMTMTCPKEMFTVHMTCKGTGKPKQDFQQAVDLLFQLNNPEEVENEEAEDAKPKVLWSLFYSQTNNTGNKSDDQTPSNVVITSGPGPTFDMDSTVAEAKGLFEQMYPGEEFLPKPPNPEDIIYCDGGEALASEPEGDKDPSETAEDGGQSESVAERDESESTAEETSKPEQITSTDEKGQVASTDYDEGGLGKATRGRDVVPMDDKVQADSADCKNSTVQNDTPFVTKVDSTGSVSKDDSSVLGAGDK